jgi:hypothetical protein
MTEETFFVLMGRAFTMSDDVAKGHLVIRVGFAVMRSGEFIEAVFSQDVAQA